MVKELTVVADIMSPPNAQGRMKVIKKNLEYRKQFESTNMLVEHYVDQKGNISKKYCMIKEGDSYFKVKGKYEDICKINSHIEIRGFK